MAGSSNNDESGITGINVTPLVDVMLVLLIIFMVTANIVGRKAINVKLPKATTGEAAEPHAVNVEVAKNGQITLDGHTLALAELPPHIAALKKASSAELLVNIAADRAAPHGAVIDVLDVLRREGVFNVSFAVAAE